MFMKKITEKGWIAYGIILLGIVVAIVAEKENKVTTKSVFAMDTYMELTACGRNSEKAIVAAEEEIYRLEALLSTGNKASEVAILNRDKKGELSEDYAYLLKRSKEIWELTQGAFDITVYPLMQAWGFTEKEYKVPSSEEIKEILSYVNTSDILFNENTKMVEMAEHTQIDFGGIAKGYTSTQIARIMKKYGVKSAMLNLGGNVQTVGAKSDGSMWRIAIKSPYESIPYLGIVSIKEKAVITSGNYERYFEENGVRYHHIISPRTGMPVQNGLVSVTIVCDDGTLADGLSTALFVMGKEDATEFWKAHHEMFDMILCDENGKLYVTEGIVESFSTELEYEVIETI